MGEINRVLIIDDNQEVRSDYKQVFDLHRDTASTSDRLEDELFGPSNGSPSLRPTPDFHLSFASQGHEGYEICKNHYEEKLRFQVAFVDMRMPPGWDGLETIEKLWEVDPDIEIVICSAYTDKDWDEIYQRLGKSDQLLYLKKPFSSIEVFQMACSLGRKWHSKVSLQQTLNSMESELKEKKAALEKQAEDNIVQSKLATIGIMTSGIAHEINNPLMVIAGKVHKLKGLLAKNSENAPTYAPVIEKIEATVHHVQDVVTGLKMLSSSKSTEVAKHSLNEIIKHTLMLSNDRLIASGIDIQLNDFDDIHLMCSPSQIIQVLFNLISNSINALAKFESPWIDIEVRQLKESNKVQILFTDSGDGIPEEIHEKIMEAFFTTDTTGQGTGLGLNICRQIIAKHGGSLRLNSLSEHTQFIIELPEAT